MGLLQVQKQIDQKLKDKKVDIVKRFIANPQKKTVTIGKGENKREVDLSSYAEQLKGFIVNNTKPLYTAEEINKANIDWRDIFNMKDEKLIVSAYYYEHMYRSLLARKDELDQETIADTLSDAKAAYDYMISRIMIISNPYYYHLNPEIFTKIPSEVISTASPYSDNPFEEELFDEATITELDNDKLHEYMTNIAKNEKVREEIAKKEARETFYSVINSGLLEITDNEGDLLVFNKIKAEKEGKVDDTPLSKKNKEKYESYKDYTLEDLNDAIGFAKSTIKETRRRIAGANRALDLLDNDTILPNYDEFNKYTSNERYEKLAEDISDEQLEKIFSETKAYKEIINKLDAIEFKAPEKKEEAVKEGVKEVVKAKEPETPAEKWYKSFSAQLREMGLDGNAIGLGLICVRNDDVEPAENIDKKAHVTLQDGHNVIENAKKAAEPAFLFRTSDNQVTFSLESGVSYSEWLNSSSYENLKSVPKAHIEYLYKMAKENKLFIKSKDVFKDGIGKNSYFFVNENGESELAPNMLELEKLSKSNDFEKIGPYSREQFNQLFDLDTKSSKHEYYLRAYTERFYNELQNTENIDMDELDILNKDMAMLASMRAMSKFAAENPNWAKDNPQLMREIGDNLALLRKAASSITEEDFERSRKQYTTLEGMDAFKDDLLKKTGSKDTDELFNNCTFKDENQKPITGENSYDLFYKLCKQVVDGKEMFVNNQPFVFLKSEGIKDSVNKQGYLSEINFLITRLTKFEGNLTKNTPEYEDFAASLKGLPEQINELGNRELDFEHLGELLDTVVQNGDKYIDAHPGKLGSRQIERVKIINRLKDIRNSITEKNVFPGKDYDYRLAEKIFTAAAVKANNHTALKSETIRSQTIEKIMSSPDFQRVQDLTDIQKEQMLKVSGSKVLKNMFTHENAVKSMKETEISINMGGM